MDYLLPRQANSVFFVKVAATAHFNCAVEFEFLRQFKEALIAYEQAVRVCEKYLGKENDTTKMFAE